MEPKEKAEYLIKKCEDQNYFSESEILDNSKHYANIIVDELIISWQEDVLGTLEYWKEVKKHINEC